jgi:hypothetical protein
VNAVTAGPLTLALGSMGAGYGGTGASLTYQESANFTFNAIGAPFVIDLLSSASLGKGFESATFQISLNGNLFYNKSFNDLASAQAFFLNDLFDISLAGGINNIQLAFNETMSGGEGFSFDYGTASVSSTPLPPSWTMMLIGLAGFAFCGWRGTKGSAAIAAA